MIGDDLPAVSTERVAAFVSQAEETEARRRAMEALQALRERRCAGQEFLGWLELPARMQGRPLEAIVETAARLRGRHPILVVVGIGGSSLGARAALNGLGRGADEVPLHGEHHPVLFAGHHLSADMIADTLRALEGKDYAVNVISKSGTTTEPGIAFRILLEDLRRRWGERWRDRVVATTDPDRGALRDLVGENALASFEVPGDVGGRFSVLSAVGLLPLAFAGLDVAALVDGAAAVSRAAVAGSVAADENPVLRLAAARHALYRAGFGVDVLSYTSPRLRRFAGWWQQLFGESEGKKQLGPFPATCEIPADLHSLGQYLQEGKRQLYETFLHVAAETRSRTVPSGDSRDGLDYLAGRPLADVLDAARLGTIDAHASGGVPVLEVTLPRLDERALGAAFYFFEVTVAVSGLLLGVNPFDQPGVEAYKRNMFQRLGRPGS